MSATIQGALTVGLLVQLYVRADERERLGGGLGWESIRARVGVLLEQAADRAVIEALPATNLQSMLRGVLDRWPARPLRGVYPSVPLLARLELVECVFGEVRDAAVEQRPCTALAANPERQLEPEVALPGAQLSVEQRLTARAFGPNCIQVFEDEDRQVNLSSAIREANAAVASAVVQARELIVANLPQTVRIIETHRDELLARVAELEKERDGWKASSDSALESVGKTALELVRVEAALAKANEDAKHWCEEFHAKNNALDESRSGRMAAEADHAELLRLYDQRGAREFRLRNLVDVEGCDCACWMSPDAQGLQCPSRGMHREDCCVDARCLACQVEFILDSPPHDVPTIRAQAEADVAALQERLEATGEVSRG